MRRSGWCPPDVSHEAAHIECQRRQNAGLIARCECSDHGGHAHAETIGDAA